MTTKIVMVMHPARYNILLGTPNIIYRYACGYVPCWVCFNENISGQLIIVCDKNNSVLLLPYGPLTIKTDF